MEKKMTDKMPEFTVETFKAVEAESKKWRVAHGVNDNAGRTTYGSLWADHKAAFEAGVSAARAEAKLADAWDAGYQEGYDDAIYRYYKTSLNPHRAAPTANN